MKFKLSSPPRNSCVTQAGCVLVTKIFLCVAHKNILVCRPQKYSCVSVTKIFLCVSHKNILVCRSQKYSCVSVTKIFLCVDHKHLFVDLERNLSRSFQLVGHRHPFLHFCPQTGVLSWLLNKLKKPPGFSELSLLEYRLRYRHFVQYVFPQAPKSLKISTNLRPILRMLEERLCLAFTGLNCRCKFTPLPEF